MCEYSSAPLDAYIEQLVQLYKNSVYAYALTLTRNTYDAEDITLEAYERVAIH
jgi:DNA-directed RNA polymerase specialized sigma24 family protein